MARVAAPVRKGIVVIAWIAVALLALALAFFAGRSTLSPAGDVSDPRPAATYTVTEGTITQVQDVSVHMSWPPLGKGVNATTGVITSREVDAGGVVNAGDIVYTVDLQPVVAAEGAVPAFRDLTRGVQGEDVAQLQRFLAGQGYGRGADDGVFGPSTSAAVRDWQRDLGLEVTGVVDRGRMVFVSSLPALVSFDEGFTLGAPVVPGQEALHLIGAHPRFVAEVAADNSRQLPVAGSAVTVWSGDSEWRAISQDPVRSEGTLRIPLTAEAGNSICGEECAQVPYSPDGVNLRASVEIVPPTTGPIVPVSAVGTDASGHTYVVNEDGSRTTVNIVATDGSQSVSPDLDPGAVIRLFAVPPESDAESEAS